VAGGQTTITVGSEARDKIASVVALDL